MARRRIAPDNAEATHSARWGVPDWRSPTGYPTSADRLSPDQLRWEFLRRDRGYAIDWERTLPADQRPLITAAPGEVKSSAATRISADVAAMRYQIRPLTDPRLNWKQLPLGFEFRRLGGNEFSFSRHTNAVNRNLIRDGLLAVLEFDITEPLEAQITRATELLRRKRSELDKRNLLLRSATDTYDPDDYAPTPVVKSALRTPNLKLQSGDEAATTYLRILDARNCGRTYAEIASGLVEDDRTRNSVEDSSIRKRHLYAQALWKRL